VTETCSSITSKVVEVEDKTMKRLAKLTWQARIGGGTCSAEVNLPIRGYRVNPKSRSNTFGASGSEGSAPVVTWISFDGDVYWVGLSAAQGWPRTIRVTQNDVDRAKRSNSQSDHVE